MQICFFPLVKRGWVACARARVTGFRMSFFMVALAALMTQLTYGQEKKKKDQALELYFNANGLFNRKLYELAAEEYEKFLEKY